MSKNRILINFGDDIGYLPVYNRNEVTPSSHADIKQLRSVGMVQNPKWNVDLTNRRCWR